MNDDVNYALPQDLFVDAHGRAYRVVGIWREATVAMELLTLPTEEPSRRIFGGVSGAMWNGFKRVYAAPQKSDT